MDTRSSRFLPSWSWCGWEGSIYLVRSDFYWTGKHGHNDLEDLVQPTTIDRANVICHTPYGTPDYQTGLCKVMHPLRVTLHMLARTCRCNLQSKPQEEDTGVHTVEPEGLKSEVRPYHIGEVRLPEDIDSESRFELLCLRDHVKDFILVRRVGTYFGRVGILWNMHLSELTDEFEKKYIRFC